MVVSSSIHAGSEMFRRLKPDQVANLNEELSKLTAESSFISKLASALSAPNWGQNEVLNDPQMPFYALVAVQRGEIPKDSFFTLLLYGSVKLINRREKILTFTLDRNGIKLLKQSALFDSIDRRFSFENYKQFQNFLEEMQKLPLSERRFFLFPAIQNSQTSILDRIQSVGCEALMYAKYRKRDYKMVPSFGMMQAFLKVRYKDNAIQINPVLGISTRKDLYKNGMEGMRDMAFHFPHVLLPKLADGYPAEGPDFTLHDFYHSHVVSHIPHRHRQQFALLSDIVSQHIFEKKQVYEAILNPFFKGDKSISSLILKYQEEEDEKIAKFRDKLLDMEFFHYHTTKATFFDYLRIEVAPAHLFWMTLAELLRRMAISPKAEEILYTKIARGFRKLDKEIQANLNDRFLRQQELYHQLIHRTTICLATDWHQNLLRHRPIYKKLATLWRKSHLPLSENLREVEARYFPRYPEPLIKAMGGEAAFDKIPTLRLKGKICDMKVYPEDLSAPVMRGKDECGRLWIAFRWLDRDMESFKPKYPEMRRHVDGDGFLHLSRMPFVEILVLRDLHSEEWESHSSWMGRHFISPNEINIAQDGEGLDRLRRLMRRLPCGHMACDPIEGVFEEGPRMREGKSVVSLV